MYISLNIYVKLKKILNFTYFYIYIFPNSDRNYFKNIIVSPQVYFIIGILEEKRYFFVIEQFEQKSWNLTRRCSLLIQTCVSYFRFYSITHITVLYFLFFFIFHSFHSEGYEARNSKFNQFFILELKRFWH